MARKGLARPFHHRVFIYNQFATNFSRYVWNSVSWVSTEARCVLLCVTCNVSIEWM
jgi:hypothetical protein